MINKKIHVVVLETTLKHKKYVVITGHTYKKKHFIKKKDRYRVIK